MPISQGIEKCPTVGIEFNLYGYSHDFEGNFGINKHEYIFQRLTKFGVFEKFTSAYLFQIAREKSCDYLLITDRAVFNDYLKTKTKAITPTNHNRNKQLHEPITIPNNYL